MCWNTENCQRYSIATCSPSFLFVALNLILCVLLHTMGVMKEEEEEKREEETEEEEEEEEEREEEDEEETVKNVVVVKKMGWKMGSTQ